MSTNPYIEKLRLDWGAEEDDWLDGLKPQTLATLAIAHELSEANALYAPSRVIVNTGETFAEDLTDSLGSVLAIPDNSGDARIAAAARRWAEAYARRNTPGAAATYHLAASELFEAIRQEDER